jgi:hypothetical protein
MSHTPGPWTNHPGDHIRRPFEIRGADGAHVADACWDQLIMDVDTEPQANAQLIAAAPDLLKFARKYYAELSECNCKHHLYQLAMGLEPVPCTHCEAGKLIAKAEGK